jgi:hypothetical protein
MSINSPSLLPDPIFTRNEQELAQSRRLSINKRDSDSMSFGFNVKKLTLAESKKATKLLAKEFSKEVGPLGKRKLRLKQQ